MVNFLNDFGQVLQEQGMLLCEFNSILRKLQESCGAIWVKSRKFRVSNW